MNHQSIFLILVAAAVVLLPIGLNAYPPSSLPTHHYRLSPSATAELVQTATSPVSTKRFDARTYLESRGIVFAPGTSAWFQPETGILTVTAEPGQLDILDTMFP